MVDARDPFLLLCGGQRFAMAPLVQGVATLKFYKPKGWKAKL